MLFHSWVHTLRSVLTRRRTKDRHGQTPLRRPLGRWRPCLEALEDRTVPSIAGSLDPTFGAGGKVLTDFGGSLSNATSTAIQSDGKIVVAGTAVNSASDNSKFAVARYNSDGSLDATFNGTGKVLTDFPSQLRFAFASSVAIESDGKIIVVGQFDRIGGYDGVVVRYNGDGSLDTTFNGTGEVTTRFANCFYDENTGVAIQSDGKIVVAGETADGTNSWGYVVRYNADGSQDTTLNASLVQSDDVSGLAIQSDGKIVVAGSRFVNGGDFDFAVVRYDSDGSLDTTFNGTGQKLIDFGVESLANSLAIQPDGKIVVAGYDLPAVGPVIPSVSFAVARCNSDGSLDATFNGTGEVTTDFGSAQSMATGVAIQSDGRIVVAGYTQDAPFAQKFALAQYNPDGSLDTNFNDTGEVTTAVGGGNSTAASLAIQSDGNIVVAGDGANDGAGASDFAVARYLDPLTFMANSLDSSGSGSLGQYVQENNQLGGGNVILLQTSAGFTPAAVIQAVNALTGVSQPVTIVLDLGGGTYSTNGVVYGPSDPTTAQNVTWIVQNGVLDPSLPALTVGGGHVIVQNCTLTTTGDAPTILVTGGNLTLQNDIVQESTGYNDAAIKITGGSLDLAGGNTLNLNGAGQFIVSTGPSLVTAAGTTYQINGVTLPTNEIDDLIAQVATLNLNSGQQNSLTSTLQAAEQSLLRANTTAAVNQLNAFIHQVNALVNSHRLGQCSADDLITDVDSIVSDIP